MGQNATGLTINLQIPEAFAEMAIDLMTQYTGYSGSEGITTSSTPTRPVLAKPPAERNSKPRLQSNLSCTASMEELLKTAPAALQRKRGRASQKQCTAHGTSARAFDRWLSLWENAPVLQTGAELLEWLADDLEQAAPVIRSAFASYWMQEAEKAPTTVLKYWQHVCMICRAHGVILEPWQLHELEALRESFFSAPPTPTVCRKLPTVEECEAIVEHATAATGPYGSHSPYFWRGLIRFFCCFGLRTRDLVSVEKKKTGLQKQNIFWDPACPDPDVNAALGYELKNPGGWIMLKIGKAAKSDVPWTLLPIPLWARGWLRFFCEFSHDDVRVFPSTQMGSSSLCQATLSSAWNQILKAADVDPNIRISEGRGDRIAIRKYSGNWWRLAVASHTGDSTLAKDVSYYVLHHGEISRSTAARHYLSVKATVLPTIVELLPQFPKPAANARPVSMLPE